MIVYDGSSQLNGQPIIAISTESENRKTGDMIQLWILDASVNPVAAAGDQDASVCGNCKHRRKSCYVALHQAPLSIYRAWKLGKYRIAPNLKYFQGRKVRLGAYGDPAALPLKLIKKIVKQSDGWTGYTHQWELPHVQKYKDYLMASVDSLEEYEKAKSLGWRCFRVKNSWENKSKQEIICPASSEAGKKSTCQKCGICSGLLGKGKKDVVINVHGLSFKVENFKRISLQTI